jgi:hypothetical protein
VSLERQGEAEVVLVRPTLAALHLGRLVPVEDLHTLAETLIAWHGEGHISKNKLPSA